jgi:hypothetical protein
MYWILNRRLKTEYINHTHEVLQQITRLLECRICERSGGEEGGEADQTTKCQQPTSWSFPERFTGYTRGTRLFARFHVSCRSTLSHLN